MQNFNQGPYGQQMSPSGVQNQPAMPNQQNASASWFGQMPNMQPMMQPPMMPNGMMMGAMNRPAFGQPQQQQGSFDFVRVNTYDDIKNAYVERGQRVWFMLQNDPVIALKMTDNVGRSETTYFKIFEFAPESEAVTSDMGRFENLAQELERRIKSIEEQVAKMKGNDVNVEPAE